MSNGKVAKGRKGEKEGIQALGRRGRCLRGLLEMTQGTERESLSLGWSWGEEDGEGKSVWVGPESKGVFYGMALTFSVKKNDSLLKGRTWGSGEG
jgi:hypothetical protein